MQIPPLCLQEKPTLGKQSCSSCPPQGQVPSAAAASIATGQVDGKGQPGAAATQAKTTVRSSAVSHHPSWINLSALFVRSQCPAKPSVPSGPVGVRGSRKTAAHKEWGDPRRLASPCHSTALNATSHFCTSILIPPPDLFPTDCHHSHLERRSPRVKMEMGRWRQKAAHLKGTQYEEL